MKDYTDNEIMATEYKKNCYHCGQFVAKGRWELKESEYFPCCKECASNLDFEYYDNAL